MKIIILNSSDLAIYQQIANQIRDEILSQKIAEGDLLPSIRALAKDLGVSVITTKKSYELLEQEGYINSVAGKGFYVASQNFELLKENKLKLLQDKLSDTVDFAKSYGIQKEEFNEIANILWEDDSYDSGQ